MKDGLGQLGGVIFASFVNNRFDVDPKRWRFVACLSMTGMTKEYNSLKLRLTILYFTITITNSCFFVRNNFSFVSQFIFDNCIFSKCRKKYLLPRCKVCLNNKYFIWNLYVFYLFVHTTNVTFIF